MFTEKTPRKPRATSRIRRALSVFLVMPVAVLVAAMAVYDVTVFLPHRQQINEIIDNASTADRTPTRAFMSATQAVDGADAIPLRVAHRLLIRAYPQRPPLLWHLDFALWKFLVALHVPAAQVEALYCILVVEGGCNQLATQLVGKPLSALSDEELIRMAVVIRSPQRYMDRPDRVSEYIEKRQLIAKPESL